MFTALTVAVAGLMPFVWHIGSALVALILLAVIAYFKSKFRIEAIRLAILIVALVGAYITGAINEKSRCGYQVSALQKELEDVQAKSVPSVHKPLNILPRVRKPADPFDRDWRN
jgi:hypothetical protein